VLLPGRIADVVYTTAVYPSFGHGLGQLASSGRHPPKTPFLLSPTFDYDVELNSFFLSGDMLSRAWNTQDGYARDLKAFLNFLWHNRNHASWRNATSADHLAYLAWRRKDPVGPRVDDATWDREVTAVNRFYDWQVSVNNVPDNPIPQRTRRPLPPTAGRRGHSEAATTAATYSHGAGRERSSGSRRPPIAAGAMLECVASPRVACPTALSVVAGRHATSCSSM
jgi:hypothetical protein